MDTHPSDSPQVIRGTGEIVKYDTTRYEFRNYFESRFGCSSSTWSQNLSVLTRSEIEEKCYSVVSTPEFCVLFKDFLDQVISPLLPGYLIQARPSVRVQIPGDRAAIFHIDSFTGHCDEMINFWFPISELTKESTLWLVSPEETSKHLKLLKDRGLSVNELDQLVQPLSLPANLSYGEILVFSNKTLHGCVDNSSLNIRVSLDFRAVPKNSTSGTKNIPKMFAYPPQPKKKTVNANTVVYCNHKAKHISHEAQRAVILDYCEKNNLTVHREDSEWHGCDTSLPLISHWAATYPHEPIVIFSRMCFDFENDDIYKRLLNISRMTNQPLLFALENEALQLQ